MKKDKRWKVIGELTDKTVLGLDGVSDKAPRKTARAIVMNDEGLYAVVYAKKFNLHGLPGGGIEAGETKAEALRREVLEETGLSLTEYKLRGIVTFISDIWEDECMFLYTASEYQGELRECDEGDLMWVPKTEVMLLNTWEGDKIFLDLLMNQTGFFELKLIYEGNVLKKHKVKVY